MALWSKVKAFVERLGDGGDEQPRLQEEELRLAAAALLVRAAVIDAEVKPEERRVLKSVLKSRFALGDTEAAELIGEAKRREQEAVDLYGFTSVLCRALDREGRAHVVEMLWEVALADGKVHEFEANLVWRAAELLGISTRDRIRLRGEVARRRGVRLRPG